MFTKEKGQLGDLYCFKPNVKLLGNYQPSAGAVIKDETMLFGASVAYALKNGQALTHAFLKNLPLDWLENPNVYIDSRVHMLMKGWYPCIPGWHHDDIPRDRADGQPDYEKCYGTNVYETEHIMWTVGDTAFPELLDSYTLLPPVAFGTVIYGVWNKLINEMNVPNIKRMVSGDMVKFDGHTFHRGTAADKFGWRFFARASKRTLPYKHKNEIRRNANVYMSALEAGW